MKKIVSIIILTVMLSLGVFILTGCKLTVETSENSVSASVDGETTEKVDNVIDWIKERIERVFNTDSNSESASGSEVV